MHEEVSPQHGKMQGIAALILVAPAIVAPMFSRSGSSSPTKKSSPADVELDETVRPSQEDHG